MKKDRGTFEGPRKADKNIKYYNKDGSVHID